MLIDGHHLLYRAYFAIPRTLKTRAGEQTNASFGLASMLIAILATEEPDALMICFDEGDETFRHQENETYKEGRAETPDDFYDQIPRAMEVVDAFRFVRVSDKQYEADDFLGTYAKAGEAAGDRVTIVTGDRDALQLASAQTRIAIPHKGYQQAEYLGPEEVLSKYGVRPDQIADFKGLTGDHSDNLPGVRGIGPKTAEKLLQEYGNLDGIYAHLAALAPSVRDKLESDRKQAYFCRRMAELVCDIPLPVPLGALMLKNVDTADVFPIFAELEFTILSKRFQRLLQSDYGKKHFVTDGIGLPEVAVRPSQLTMF